VQRLRCFRRQAERVGDLLLALGGVVPFLSFILEVRTARSVRAYLAEREASEASAPVPAPEGPR